MPGNMSFLVERGKDAVFYESHVPDRETLNTKMEVEEAK